MAKFGEVIDVDTMLDYGKHLVKISDVRNKNQEGEIMLDENGFELWNVTFQDKNGAIFREYFRFSGKMANKTGYMLRAVGVLEPDEKLAECKKEILPEDVLGSFLYIEIVENPNAQKDKYKKTIAFSGFEKYEGTKKVETKKLASVKKSEPPKAEVIGEDMIPF